MANRLFADVSNYNERFDAHAYVKGGHQLVMILATDGVVFTSPKYVDQANHAHEAGVAVWHYHFCRPEVDPAATGEASHFWTVVKPHYRPGDRLVLDVERRHPGGAKGLIDYTHSLDGKLQKISGVHAVAYTYDSLLREVGHRWQVSSGDWHVASYGSRPAPLGWGRRMVAWQYTDGLVGPEPHRFAGIGPCDGNRLAFWYARKLQRAARRRA
jgi:lysozyme